MDTAGDSPPDFGMIVTIDGPAGAGKSTVARRLAERLGFGFLDTGAMYRAVALAGMRRGLDWGKPESLAQLARSLRIDLVGARVLLNGEDVTALIRSPEVTASARYAADNWEVRDILVKRQRELARGQNLVTEGRDQGTVVFPDAQCKIFLMASPEERARRRVQDFAAQGHAVSFDRVLADILRRDREDSQRPVGALIRAPDAIEVCSDGWTIDQTVDRLEAIVRAKLYG